MYNSIDGEQLYKYYNQYKEVIIEFLKRDKREDWKSEIHEFRVGIKKIKGIFKLIELCSSDFDAKKHLNPYRKLFKPAGFIREAQINLFHLKKLEDSDSYIEIYKLQQKNIKRIQKEKFKQQIAKFKIEDILLVDNKIAQICNAFSSKLIIDNSKRFISSRKIDIKTLLSEDFNEEHLHEARKKIKEISSILGLLTTLNLFENMNNRIGLLKLYEDRLGLWHDRVVLRNSLNEFIACHQFVSPESKLKMVLLVEKIKKLEREFTDNLKSFEEEVITLLPTFEVK